MDRFFLISDLMVDAYQKDDLFVVNQLANEYLTLATDWNDSWNYGNALHQANLYLGLIAMNAREIDKAKDYLIRSGKVPSSPQLKTFGPNMLLAKALLEQGESAIVLDYLELCKSFWGKVFRLGKIRKWKNAIKAGEIPDFGANLLYHELKSGEAIGKKK